jgi:multidrug efflux system membrane fusion protein
MEMKRNVCFLLGLVMVLSWDCRPRNDNGAERIAVSVKAVRAQMLHEPLPIHLAGRIFPKTQVNLAFKTGGVIGRICAEEGQKVTRGQLLAVLELAEVQAHFDQAQQGFAKADRDLQRVDNLYQSRATTMEMLQNVRTARDVAAANLEIARFNMRHSRIEAPADGRILKRLCEAREMAGPGMPVLVFASSRSRWILRSGVTDRDVARLRIGDVASVRIDALPGVPVQAEVAQIAAAASPLTGTYEIELALEMDDRQLKAGFFARAAIRTSEKESLSLIPVEAMVEGDGLRAIVYILDRRSGQAHKREVLIRELRGTHLAVSGLPAHAEVITEGATYVSDGSPVRFQDGKDS